MCVCVCVCGCVCGCFCVSKMLKNRCLRMLIMVSICPPLDVPKVRFRGLFYLILTIVREDKYNV